MPFPNANEMRGRIRDELVERLTHRTDAGARVSASRARNIWRQGLPAIVVYPVRQDWKVETQGPREYAVNMTLAVEIYVEETDSGPADDQVDAIMGQVLSVVFADPSLGLPDVDLLPTSDDASFGERTKKKLGSAVQTFDVHYIVKAPEGELGELGDFATAHVEHEQPPVDGPPRDAVDHVAIP